MAVNLPGSLYLSAVAVYFSHTDFMIGPTTFGSLIGGGSLLLAWAEMISFDALPASAPPAFIISPQRLASGSAVNTGLPS